MGTVIAPIYYCIDNIIYLKGAKMKTIAVDKVKSEVNRMLRVSTCSAECRQGITVVLGYILHETNNYRGFNYLDGHEVPPGQLAGIIRSANIEKSPHLFPDESRRYYY